MDLHSPEHLALKSAKRLSDSEVPEAIKAQRLAYAFHLHDAMSCDGLRHQSVGSYIEQRPA